MNEVYALLGNVSQEIRNRDGEQLTSTNSLKRTFYKFVGFLLDPEPSNQYIHNYYFKARKVIETNPEAEVLNLYYFLDLTTKVMIGARYAAHWIFLGMGLDSVIKIGTNLHSIGENPFTEYHLARVGVPLAGLFLIELAKSKIISFELGLIHTIKSKYNIV